MKPTLPHKTRKDGAPAGFVYDDAGDVIDDNLNQYLYDAEGRICAVRNKVVGVMTGYVYDAGGTRVAKGSITSWSCDPTVNGFRAGGETDYVLGPSGEQAAEVAINADHTVTWLHTNVWANGALIATYDPNGLHFYLNDPLGTRRVQTSYAGVAEQTCQSLPYGDGETCAPTPTEHLFTGKERDSESGNDYFGARYYASSMGRFMSPDWAAKEEPVPYAKLDDPQTLNLYSYVRNNPLVGVDADGHDALLVTDKATGQVTLVIPVHYTGSGATPERIQQIVDRDNSLNTNGSPVKIQVISTDKPMNGVLNTLDVSPGPDAKMCGAAGSCVNTAGGNKGHIDSNDKGINDSGPHEDLHFAGIKDEYIEGPKDANGNRTAVPAPGYDNSNIMTSRPGTNLKPEQLQEADKNKTTKHCTTDTGKTTCQ